MLMRVREACVGMVPVGSLSVTDEGRGVAAAPPDPDLDQFLASPGCSQRYATLVPNGL